MVMTMIGMVMTMIVMTMIDDDDDDDDGKKWLLSWKMMITEIFFNFHLNK